jgi:hypothetical protein
MLLVIETVLVQNSPDNDYTRMIFTVCFETDISKPVIVFIETTWPIFLLGYNVQPQRLAPQLSPKRHEQCRESFVGAC